MNLVIDNCILERLDMSADELRLDMAMGLYVDRRVSLGQAASIAGISQTSLRMLLGQRGVCISYEVEDYEHDRALLRERGAI